jgi:hypothetical protein
VYSAGSGSTLLPADRDKIVAIEQEMRDSLQQFLSPQEANEFIMRVSTAGAMLRQALLPFRPTEAEYRALYPLYQAYIEQFPATPLLGAAQNLTPEQTYARNAAIELLSGQVKSALGEERAADFQQTLDPQYYQLNRLAARLDLPLSAAKQVMAVQRDVQQQLAAIRQLSRATRTDPTPQLVALAQDATARISTALGGARGLEAYKQYGGQWLNNLVPRRPAGGK